MISVCCRVVKLLIRISFCPFIFVLIFNSYVLAKDLIGAGASFPFPIYVKWAETYYKKTGVAVNYQSIGSRGGINQMKAGTVDFGATDTPLKIEDLNHYDFWQFPTVLGGLVPVYNIKSVPNGSLKLTGKILSQIYLGEITRWNDKRIVELNPDLSLPDSQIVPLYRSDGSGATEVFTTYLSESDLSWKERVGSASSVAWPVGQGGKGNEGIAALVKQIDYSISYVESAFASQNNLSVLQLENKAGFFVLPNLKTFRAAAIYADWTKTEGFGISLINQEGKESWPIMTPTFILVPRKSHYPKRTIEVLKFFDWIFKEGDGEAQRLEYVPLPHDVKDLIRASWKDKVKTIEGKNLWHEEN